jgi:CRP-like cAMP-binding protein
MVTAQELGEVGLFAGLSQTQLETLAGLAEAHSYAEGEALFREGEGASQLFLLMAGKVRIQVQLTSRPQIISITIISQPGSLVGWSGLVPPNNYTATALCQAKSRLLALDGAALMRVLEADPAMGFIVMRRLTEVISGRLQNLQRVVLKTL